MIVNRTLGALPQEKVLPPLEPLAEEIPAIRRPNCCERVTRNVEGVLRSAAGMLGLATNALMVLDG